MKHIGVCADIHMGMFDDSKYVNAMRQEFADEPEPAKQVTLPAPKVEVDDATAIQLAQALEAAKDQDALDDTWRRNGATLVALKEQRPEDFETCRKAAAARKAHFTSLTKAA